MLPGFTVEILPSIGSTNSELMRRFRAAAQVEPCLLVAEHQTAGRGRVGRTWQSSAGASLTFSLGMAMDPVEWSGLSLAVGVSLAQSLSPLSAGVRPVLGLKWPNDLWLDERKLGGILVETASAGDLRYVVVGVGLNVLRQESVATPEVGAFTAASLDELDPAWRAPSVLQAVVAPLVQDLQAFAQLGFGAFQTRFAARDVLAGREVMLSNSNAGTAHGVSESGALRILTAKGMQEVSSSEVSVRPRGHALPMAFDAGQSAC